MTFYTKRNDLQIIFFCVRRMVIFLCGLVAFTKPQISRQKCTIPYCMSNGKMGLIFSWEFCSVTSYPITTIFCFEVLCLICLSAFYTIAFSTIFIIFSFVECFQRLRYAAFIAYFRFRQLFRLQSFFCCTFMAHLAMPMMSIRKTEVFVKFRQWFGLFAFCAGFHYNRFSHFRFLSKRDWLEPLSQPICVEARSILSPFPFMSRRTNGC